MIRRGLFYSGGRRVSPYTLLSICQCDNLRRRLPSSAIAGRHTMNYGASGPLGLRSWPGNAPQTPLEEHFIYCIILPGFECHSSPIRQSSDPYMTKMIEEILPQYIMVKVGISARSNPADRLNEIMRGFEGFGANSTLLQNSDESSIIEKCKNEASIIFLKRCYDLEQNVRVAETKIRQLLTIDLDLGHSFRDPFKRCLEPSKHQYVDSVGMTEWILADKSRMKRIQEEFRQNGITKSPFTNTARPSVFRQNPTGEDVYRQIYGVVDSFVSLQTIVCVDVPRVSEYNVEIKFIPTGFSFPLKLKSY